MAANKIPRKKKTPNGQIPHGTVSRYNNAKCRCELCCKAKSEYTKEVRNRTPESRARYRESDRKRVERNRERVRANLRAWSQANKERYPEYRARYVKANRSKVLETARNYRDKNRSKIKEDNRKYHQSPKGQVVAKARDHRRRARKNHAPGIATKEQVKARWDFFGGLCWMCHQPASGMDHVIPLARGGSNWTSQSPPCL